MNALQYIGLGDTPKGGLDLKLASSPKFLDDISFKEMPFAEIPGSAFVSAYVYSNCPSFPFPDEVIVQKFLAESTRELPDNAKILDVGCGPMPIYGMVLAHQAAQIQFGDYCEENLAFLKEWLTAPVGEPSDPWMARIRWAYNLATKSRTGHKDPKKIAAFESAFKAKARSGNHLNVSHCDLTQKRPLGTKAEFDVVSCIYAAEQAAFMWGAQKNQWEQVFRNLASLVKPGGLLLMSLVDGDFYNIYQIKENQKVQSGISIPIARLSVDELHFSLDINGFEKTGRSVQSRRIPGGGTSPAMEYERCILVRARKAGKPVLSEKAKPQSQNFNEGMRVTVSSRW